MNDPYIDARKRFVEAYALKLVDHTGITEEILKLMKSRGEEWPWVEEWVAKDAPLWTNAEDTLVFEIPPGKLVDRQAMNFTQDVWMMQPSVFEHQTWGGRTFVRMAWTRR